MEVMDSAEAVPVALAETAETAETVKEEPETPERLGRRAEQGVWMCFFTFFVGILFGGRFLSQLEELLSRLPARVQPKRLHMSGQR